MSVDPSAPMTCGDEDASSGSGDDVNMLDGHNKRQSMTPSNSGRPKRSRKATGDAIVDAMLEIAAVSKMRAAAIMKNEDRFSISKCIKVLDEMQGVDQRIYFLALDLLENPSAREIFISLRSEKRLPWLQGKYISASMDDFELELDEMELVAAAAGYYYYNTITKQPGRSLSPSGCGFMTELRNGNDDVCREMFRMDKLVFYKLCATLRQRGLLRDTAGVMIEEQLAIFLNIVGHNERNRVIQERFQHSGETISRHFNNVLKAIKSLSREFLQPPPLTTPPEILFSNRFYPYFKDCIGVIDGMHIPAHIPAKDQSRFRNRKGVLSQNVLAACTFDLQFIFMYPGWEGAAADSRVLRAVLDDPDQNFPPIPEGKYYLVDADYLNMEGFIAPHPGVRYLPRDYKGANQLPRNAKELFNHRHSCLRNAILRCFDVLKTRFPILKLAPQYAFHIQRDIVIASCVLHNFIRREERNDWLFNKVEGMAVEELPDSDDQPDMHLASSMQEQISSTLRESIAEAMWNDFINRWDEW
ncbi:DDE_4 domain-containing protein [Cephalotus follicularis]|uniref:DDE_4 domain-containing protein n=1 Tax=Cephalotus follicularis TaxID=3775 RepID=A0A1Q3CXR1_CEPFO|nr:DDE_4 domain-containing protein [Cephalotus follicularis]